MCSIQFGYAQNFSVSGEINDSNNKPIEQGSAIILLTKDSSIIKGELFMDGQYKVTDVSENEFLLKITALGFQDALQKVSRKNNDTIIDMGTIQLRANTDLKEVEVVSKIPLFERDGEKVKVYVENSALSSIGTVLDVLRKSPTVQVNSNDVVSVFGKGNAIIYLDE